MTLLTVRFFFIANTSYIFCLIQYLLNFIGIIFLLSLFIAFGMYVHNMGSSQAYQEYAQHFAPTHDTNGFIKAFENHLQNLQNYLFIGFYVFCFLVLCLLVISNASLIWIIHEKENKRPTHVGQAIWWSIKKFIPISFINALALVVSLFTIPGLFPINILAVIFALMLNQWYYLVLLENKGFFRALADSPVSLKGGARLLFKKCVLWIGVCGYSPTVVRYAIWKALGNNK